jgi:hypothetical protein
MTSDSVGRISKLELAEGVSEQCFFLTGFWTITYMVQRIQDKKQRVKNERVV